MAVHHGTLHGPAHTMHYLVCNRHAGGSVPVVPSGEEKSGEWAQKGTPYAAVL